MTFDTNNTPAVLVQAVCAGTAAGNAKAAIFVFDAKGLQAGNCVRLTVTSANVGAQVAQMIDASVISCAQTAAGETLSTTFPNINPAKFRYTLTVRGIGNADLQGTVIATFC